MKRQRSTPRRLVKQLTGKKYETGLRKTSKKKEKTKRIIQKNTQNTGKKVKTIKSERIKKIKQDTMKIRDFNITTGNKAQTEMTEHSIDNKMLIERDVVSNTDKRNNSFQRVKLN